MSKPSIKQIWYDGNGNPKWWHALDLKHDGDFLKLFEEENETYS